MSYESTFVKEKSRLFKKDGSPFCLGVTFLVSEGWPWTSLPIGDTIFTLGLKYQQLLLVKKICKEVEKIVVLSLYIRKSVIYFVLIESLLSSALIYHPLFALCRIILFDLLNTGKERWLWFMSQASSHLCRFRSDISRILGSFI